eukprot:GFYU01003070.1.p1 GENE.GFYU01003070.1~~GFYU01003070.1.p1  ORF type:complete len:470 (-),score=154.30 GFYU01003070.1:88-1497(-)
MTASQELTKEEVFNPQATAEESRRWNVLKECPLTNDDGVFSKILATEQSVSLDVAKRFVYEYKKFVFLCTVSRTPVTPSEEVDQVWHMHLADTKGYANMCRLLIENGMKVPFLDHNPTVGGDSEKIKYSVQYDKTIQRLNDWWGTVDTLAWPSNEQRFGEVEDMRWVDVNGAYGFASHATLSQIKDVNTDGWTSAQKSLWESLCDFKFDNVDDITFGFVLRHAREMGIPEEESQLRVTEYIKFMFLKVVSGKGDELLASDLINHVWRLHLTYTKSYSRFCALCTDSKSMIECSPLDMWKTWGEKEVQMYKETLALYKQWFGSDAPACFWPSAEKVDAAPAKWVWVNYLQTKDEAVVKRLPISGRVKKMTTAFVSTFLATFAIVGVAGYTGMDVEARSLAVSEVASPEESGGILPMMLMPVAMAVGVTFLVALCGENHRSSRYAADYRRRNDGGCGGCGGGCGGGGCTGG